MKKDNLIVDKSFEFALLILDLYKKLKEEKEFDISRQVMRSGTSIGANINEAVAGESKKDFIHKLSISLKESHETVYWLRLIKMSNITEINVDKHLEEAQRLIRILTSIIVTSKKNLKQKARSKA